MTNEAKNAPICPECRCGELSDAPDADYPRAVECDNCDRWWTTPPAPGTPMPGTFLYAERRAAMAAR